MRKPVTADVVNPARIVAAVANNNHTVFEIAAYLGVNHSSALLRSTLNGMVDDGLLVETDPFTTPRFTLPWEVAPSLDDPSYESEMTLRAMQDDRAATERDPDCGCTSSNGDKYCELHGETPGY